jgi:energy-coupling factor transporter ATP-binding protein EcfA2
LPLIEFTNLSYTYAGARAPALSSINLTIEKGEFLLLTGATGSGKTTLCRCLNGLIPHRYAGGKIEGSVTVSGLNTSRHPANEIALHCGYVFQNPENQLFALTVEKNVSFALENAGMEPSEIRARIEWALRSVGMLELRKRPPYDLSGGQQQRVAIASALALKPEILIMDEPTAYLDPLTSKSIIGLAAELNKSLGMTIILVEHKLETAALFASRITILKSGLIARDGEVRDILFGDDLEELAVSVPKTILVYKQLRKRKSTIERMPLDPIEAGRSLRKISK